MNAAERRAVVVAVLLLVLGWGARALPGSVCDGCGDLTLVQATPSSPAESIAELSSRQSTWDSTSKASPVHKSRTKAKTQKSSGPVHVNRASAKELEGIKGVGPVLAKKILTERERIGKFSGPADLDRVPGIGKKKLDNLLPFLIFD